MTAHKVISALFRRWWHCPIGTMLLRRHCGLTAWAEYGRVTYVGCDCGQVFYETSDGRAAYEHYLAYNCGGLDDPGLAWESIPEVSREYWRGVARDKT